MPQDSHHAESARLRKLASDPSIRYKWIERKLKKIEERGISKFDIISLLKRCNVVRVEQSNFEETWNAQGMDVDGNSITVVVVAYEDRTTIKVITAWRD
jgi:hypothetical protein